MVASRSMSAFPASHCVQPVLPDEASALLVWPIPHATHAIVDAVLNRPAEHAVQVEAPGDVKVFVIKPAAQATHATVDVDEY